MYHHFTGEWETPDVKILELFFGACQDMFRICNGEYAQDKLLFRDLKFSDPFGEIKAECFAIIQSYSQYPRRAAFPLQCHQIWETMVGRIHLTIDPVKEPDTLKI